MDLPEEQYLGYFLNGLKESIRRRVRVFEPREVMRAIDLARMLEDEAGGEGRNQRMSGWKDSLTASWGQRGVWQNSGGSMRTFGSNLGSRPNGPNLGKNQLSQGQAAGYSNPFVTKAAQSQQSTNSHHSISRPSGGGTQGRANGGSFSRGGRNLTY